MNRTLTIFWLTLVGIAAAISLAAASPIQASISQLGHPQSAVQNQQLVPAAAVPCNVITGRVVDSPNTSTAPVISSLSGVTVITANDVWAVGAFRNASAVDRTLIEHWDGTQWARVTSPNAGSGGNYLREVSGSATDDVWAVGSAVGVGAISLHWDGTQWTNVPVPNLGSASSNFQGVKDLAPDNVWAVGSFGHAGLEQTVTMRWDGTQWLVIPSIVLGSMSAFYDIDAIATNDIWAVGKYRSTADSPEQTLIAHYDGITWSVVSSPNTDSGITNYLYGVSMVSASDIWAVGTYDIDLAKTLVLHYNGSTWSIAYSAGDGALNEVVAISASDVWAVGFDYEESTGKVVPVSGQWNGSSWSQEGGPAIGSSNSSLISVAKDTSGDLWAVGKGQTDVTTTDEAYVAHRVSNQWSVVPDQTDGSTMNALYGIDALASDDVWAVGTTGAFAHTLVERWNGASWDIVPSPNVEPSASVASYLWAVSGTAANNVWAVGRSKSGTSPEQTLVMRWNGSSWSIMPSPNVGSGANFLYGVDALSSTDAWAVGDSSAGEPLIMRWNGTQWNVVITPDVGVNARLTDVEAISANDVWTVGRYLADDETQEQALILHWNGTAWTQTIVGESGIADSLLRGVSAVAANDVWAVGEASASTSTGQALTLHWDGTQWAEVSTGFAATMSTLYAVDAVATNSVWAVGSYHNGAEQTLTLRWDGSNWNDVGSPNVNSQRNVMYAVAAAATNDVWSVGQYANNGTTLTLAEQFGPASFADVPSDNPFYAQVQCLVCRGIVNGYLDGTFRPNNNVTRGQLAKIVSNSAGFSQDPGPQLFEDIAPGSTFYDWVNRLASLGHIGGYQCGGEGEPCGPDNLPYFRPNANATRGQISKIVSNAAGFSDPATTQTFEDVAPGSTFYLWVERLASRGIMGGYQCGGEGEPCGPDNLPYFRPGNNATRGQSSKIVANAFFPNCQTR
jgi:hypothetical protein